jgi:hypothetical protein
MDESLKDITENGDKILASMAQDFKSQKRGEEIESK